MAEKKPTFYVLPPEQRSTKAHTLAEYEAGGGYRALRTAMAKKPHEVLELVKASGIRGRGGAGFPTGIKWGFLPRDYVGEIYLAVNADESEPGTAKDRAIMEQWPHTLIEGIVIASYAIKATTAYIYIRGEYFDAIDIMERALDEARKAGYLGKNILGSGYDLACYVHSGAGAYICGEETGLLNSLEGGRGEPRNKPPFPAIKGLYQKPTIINNVETLAALVPIVNNGPDWWKSFGTEKSTGVKIYTVSGHVKRPGNYELPMDITARELIYDVCGGIRDGHVLKGFIPGGASAPVLSADDLDVVMDFDGLKAAGSMLGSAAVMVFDETVCAVWAAMNVLHFFEYESCGQCTPCREGTNWVWKALKRFEYGGATLEEIDLLYRVGDNIFGRSICALGDAASWAVCGFIRKFRADFEEHVRLGRCPINETPGRYRYDGFRAPAAR